MDMENKLCNDQNDVEMIDAFVLNEERFEFASRDGYNEMRARIKREWGNRNRKIRKTGILLFGTLYSPSHIPPTRHTINTVTTSAC